MVEVLTFEPGEIRKLSPHPGLQRKLRTAYHMDAWQRGGIIDQILAYTDDILSRKSCFLPTMKSGMLLDIWLNFATDLESIVEKPEVWKQVYLFSVCGNVISAEGCTIRNIIYKHQEFRKLERLMRIDFAIDKTLFVGANNSGENTSAMDALKFFSGAKGTTLFTTI